MLKIRRICIPLGLNCNFQCKYCYRDLEKLSHVPNFTLDMIQYLNNLNPSWCEAVVASGGEPLMYWNKIQKLFSYVPEDVHKVIMTNGSLMNQDIVNYVNQKNIEVHLSHDGPKTSFLRGIDVFNDNYLLSLFRQIKTIRIFSVVTKYNNDVWENFFDSIQRLGRTDVFYDTTAIGDNNIPEQQELIQGFDYDLFMKTWTEYYFSHYNNISPFRNGRLLSQDPMRNLKTFGGFNILPNGVICGMSHICSNYGTIHTENYESLMQKLREFGQEDKCNNCSYNQKCAHNIQLLSDHTCKIKKMKIDFFNNQEKVKAIKDTIEQRLPDIEKQYGYNGI